MDIRYLETPYETGENVRDNGYSTWRKKSKILVFHRYKGEVKLILYLVHSETRVSGLRVIEEKKYNTLLNKKVRIIDFFLAFVAPRKCNDTNR